MEILTNRARIAPGPLAAGLTCLVLSLAACAPTSPARGTAPGRTLVGAACEAPADAPRPQLEVEALDGHPASWQSLRGTTTLIDVWATWCSACRGTLRAVDEVARSVPRDKLRVIALSVDRDRDDAREWLADSLPDRQLDAWQAAPGITFRALDINSLPATVLLDRHGRVLARHEGSDPAALATFLAQARRCAS